MNNQSPFGQQPGQFSAPGQFAQPQQNGFAQPQQQGFTPQPQQFAPQPQAPAGEWDASSVFGFTKSYDDIDTAAENKIDLNPGIYVLPVSSVDRWDSDKGNKAVRINFASGAVKADGNAITFDNSFWLLDKTTGYITFDSKQVEKLRIALRTTFKLKLEQVMPPIQTLMDIHAMDGLIYNLNQAITGRKAALEINWPKEANSNGNVYLELRYMNPESDYDYMVKKFSENIKPGSAGSTAVPAGPAGGPPRGATPPTAPGGMPTMPPAPPVHLPQANPTATANAPVPQAQPQQFQQPVQQQAPQFQQPVQQFQQPQQQVNPYQQPAQQQAPIQQQAPNFQQPQQGFQQPQQPSFATTAPTQQQQPMGAPTAAPAQRVEAGSGAPVGIDPMTIPHKAFHTDGKLQWNAHQQQFQYLHKENTPEEYWDLLPF